MVLLLNGIALLTFFRRRKAKKRLGAGETPPVSYAIPPSAPQNPYEQPPRRTQ